MDIYRKPTTTDTTINVLSNQPTEHKTSAYRYHINRMLSLPLTEERRQAEWETIQTKAQNNNYSNTHIARLKRKYSTKLTKEQRKMKTKNGQHLHITAQKSKSLPISLTIQT
jgi:hypothetical protein